MSGDVFCILRGVEKNALLTNFGATLRRLRRARGLTQEELAHRSGLHRMYISKIERGEHNPTLLSVLAFAGALEMAASDLLRETGQ